MSCLKLAQSICFAHMGSLIGAIKVAAAKAGCSVTQYCENKASGLKWCTRCELWKEVAKFNADASRGDGLNAQCRECRAELFKARYKPRPKVSRRGLRYAPVRAGDKKQARARVNHLIRGGVIPRPELLPCSTCNHLGEDRRHEYHHFLGYGAQHQESVKVLCSKCHSHEEKLWENKKRDTKGKFYGGKD